MEKQQHIEVSKRLVALNSASAMVTKLINFLVVFWTYQYLLHRISAQEFAVYPVVMATMVFAPLFFSFFTTSISRYIVAAYAKGEFGEVGKFVSSIFPFLLSATVIFLCVSTLAIINIEKLLNIAPEMIISAKIMLGMLVVNFALRMLSVPFSVGFDVQQRYVELNFIGILRDLFRVFLLVLFLLGIGPQVIWVVCATVFSDIVYICVIVVRSRNIAPDLRFEWRLFNWEMGKTLLSFGLWTTLGQIGQMMYTSAATIILNLYGTAVDVTSYHLGASLYNQIRNTILVASQPLQPVLTAMSALNNEKQFRNAVLRGGRYALWASLAVATPLAIYSREFIGLYLGSLYPDTATVIVLFMIIFPVTQPNALLAKASIASARVREFHTPAFLFQLVGLCLMLYLVVYKDFGAVGATLSLSIITIVGQMYFFPLMLRITNTSFSFALRNTLLPGLAPAAVAAIFWIGLELLMTPKSWVALGVDVSLGGMVYLLVLIRFCLDDNERKDLRKLLKRRELKIA